MILLQQPRNFNKKTFKVIKKGKLKKLSIKKTNTLKFGDIGIKAASSGVIRAKQLEAARKAISRKTERKGKIWIRVSPILPITDKPKEARMGKGKGSISFWAFKVVGGNVLFEICGVKEDVAHEALRLGGAKLPVRTKIFKY